MCIYIYTCSYICVYIYSCVCWIFVYLCRPIILCVYLCTFIQAISLYSASSNPLLLRGAHPDTARILCLSFTPKRHRQLRVEDVSTVPIYTWRPQWDSNPRPFGRKAPNLPMSHHAPHASLHVCNMY